MTFSAPQASSDADNPFRRDAAVDQMSPAWGVMDLATRGTEYLRDYCRGAGAAGWGAFNQLDYAHAPFRNILPKEHKEPDDAWAARVDRAVLSPYTARLIDNAASLILRRPIQLEGDSYWEAFAVDVDGWGSSLNEFARRLLRGSLTYGHSGILVDRPQHPAPISLVAERAALGARPYFINFSPKRILGWRQAGPYPTAPMVQLRLLEVVQLPEGKFGEVQYEQVRVITPTRYEVHRRKIGMGSMGALAAAGENQLNTIPFVPLYTNRTGFLRSSPPLLDIGEINLAHFQRQADLLHALHIAAMPKLVMEGWQPEEGEDGLGVGVNYAIITETGNKVYYVPSDSSSFAAQQEQLRMFEAQMSSLGVTRLLGQKMVAEAAEAKRVEQAQSNSVMAIVSLELEHCLNAAFYLAAQYAGVEPPTITLDRDFDFYRLIGQDISVLADATVQGLLSPQMWLEAMRKGEVLPDTADYDDELEYIKRRFGLTKGTPDLTEFRAEEAAEDVPAGVPVARPQPPVIGGRR